MEIRDPEYLAAAASAGNFARAALPIAETHACSQAAYLVSRRIRGASPSVAWPMSDSV
jgi:hypothetical protein